MKPNNYVRVAIDRLLRIAVAVGGLIGCGAAADVTGPPIWPSWSLVLSPSPELYAVTMEAATRWREATGLDILVGGGGIPVEYVDKLLNDDGDRLCAQEINSHWKNGTNTAWLIRVNRDLTNCGSPLAVVLHEVGHALLPDAPDNLHADTGMFSDTATQLEWIDAPAVELICSYRECH